MEDKKYKIKPRDIVIEALSKKNENTIHFLTASIEEMLKIWNTSNIPSGITKKRFKVLN